MEYTIIETFQFVLTGIKKNILKYIIINEYTTKLIKNFGKYFDNFLVGIEFFQKILENVQF